MPDVPTCCMACGQCYATKRGLATHLTISGHRAAHERTMNAAAVVDGYTSRDARPFECTFPGCRARFRSAVGRKIHQTLLGHQPAADHVVTGDGPDRIPTHPAHRPEPPA